MAKILPMSLSRYKTAFARRLAPEYFVKASPRALDSKVSSIGPIVSDGVRDIDQANVVLASVSESKPSLETAISSHTVENSTHIQYISLPQRIELRESMAPRLDAFGYEELLEGMKAFLNFYYLDDDAVGMVRVISAAEDSHDLLNALLVTAYENAFEVQINSQNGNERIRANVRNTHELLAAQKRINLVLIDQRSESAPLLISVESWTRTAEGHLSSPQNNRTLSRIWKGTLDNLEFGKEISGAHENSITDLRTLLPAKATDEVEFDIDWVFSWVNGDDPDWKQLFSEWAPETKSDAADKSRFVTRDDLKYSLRSLDTYAPWVRKIHILTNCKAPEWLNSSHPRINWVDHSEVFEASDLPTFSSHAIETVLHRIPGLSKHFVYSNDDFFLTRMTQKHDFFYSNGIARLRLENYGMVNGPVTSGEPDYLNAARNSAALILNEQGSYPVRLHTHSPQSMNRSLLEEMEEKFFEEFARTRSNKFRHSTDIAVTGFLYHHYAYVTGRAVPDGGNTRLIQQNHNFNRLFENLLQDKQTGKTSRFLSVCVNDGKGSSDNNNWGESAFRFVNEYYPVPSQFEMP